MALACSDCCNWNGEDVGQHLLGTILPGLEWRVQRIKAIVSSWYDSYSDSIPSLTICDVSSLNLKCLHEVR